MALWLCVAVFLSLVPRGALSTALECPEDYEWLGKKGVVMKWIKSEALGKCYAISPFPFFRDGPLTEDPANYLFTHATCQSEICAPFGGALASIRSSSEQDFIASSVVASSSPFPLEAAGNYAWVGLYRLPSSPPSSWSWSSHSPDAASPLPTTLLVGDEKYYADWARGQPDNVCGAEFCGALGAGHSAPSARGGSEAAKWFDLDCRTLAPCICEFPASSSEEYDDAQGAIVLDDKHHPLLECYTDYSSVVGILLYSLAVLAATIAAVSCCCCSFRSYRCLPCSSSSNNHPFTSATPASDFTKGPKFLAQRPIGAVPGDKLLVVGPFSGEQLAVEVPPGIPVGGYFEVSDSSSSAPSMLEGGGDSSSSSFPSLPKSNCTGDSLCCFEPQSALGARSLGACCCMSSDPDSARRLHAPARKKKGGAGAGEEGGEGGGKQSSSYDVVPGQLDTRAFDAIRGWGAIQVFSGHFYVYFAKRYDGGATSPPPETPEFGGGNAVLMFFIMSGFLMTVGYAKKQLVKPDGGCHLSRGWWDFMSARVARVGPLVWTSIALFIPFTAMQFFHGVNIDPSFNYAPSDAPEGSNLAQPSVKATISAYLTTVFFVQSYAFSGNINGPLWSVCSQFFCYTIFPYIVGPMHTVRTPLRLWGEVFFWWFWYALFFVALSFISYLLAHILPYNKIFLFNIGIVFASAALTNSCVVRTEASAKSYKFRWSVVCNSVTLFMTAYMLLQVIGSFDPALKYTAFGFDTRLAGEIFLPIAYAVWLYSFTQAGADCLSNRVFRWRPFKVLADYSFAFYTFHWPITTYYAWARFGNKYWLESTEDVRLERWELIPVFFIVLATSAVGFYCIEKPLRPALTKLLGRLGNKLGCACRSPSAAENARVGQSAEE